MAYVPFYTGPSSKPDLTVSPNVTNEVYRLLFIDTSSLNDDEFYNWLLSINSRQAAQDTLQSLSDFPVGSRYRTTKISATDEGDIGNDRLFCRISNASANAVIGSYSFGTMTLAGSGTGKYAAITYRANIGYSFIIYDQTNKVTSFITAIAVPQLYVEGLSKPINFYANPSGYNANKGETVTPNFVMVYDSGTIVEPYTDIIYDDSIYFNDNVASLADDGISIILSTNNRFNKRLDFKVRPNITDTELWTIFHIIVDDVENPYYDEDSSGIGGGNGSYGQGENYFDTLDKIPEGSAEANDSRGTMYTRYLVSLNEMSTLGNWLWADEFGLQVAKTAISLLYGDPVQTVISCVSYPFNLSNVASSSSVPFHWGGHDAGFNLSALNQNAFSIDWGTITISEYWGNFLDYSPHTQMQLYLPWGTGFVHIDPNDIMKSNSSSSLTGRGTLGIKTNVDLSRGICVHNVIANNTVIGSYSGSCGRQIPITGSDYASKQVAVAGAAIGAMVAGGVSAGMGAAEGSARAIRTYDSSGVGYRGPKPITVTRRFNTDAAVGGFSQAGRTAFRPAVASAAALAVSPPSVSRSGSFQEGAGSLSIQQPYLIISRPKMSMPRNYGHLYGYPSNITTSLGSVTGYTEVGAIHIDGISATSQEIEEIESLLMGGVIL